MGDETLMARKFRSGRPKRWKSLYDRYSGILKSLIMGVIHNDAEADDLLQEIFMEIWNQAAHYSAQKGKPLGWIVTLTRRRSIDRLRKKQAYARAEERLQNETETTARSLGTQFDGGRHRRFPTRVVSSWESSRICRRPSAMPSTWPSITA